MYGKTLQWSFHILKNKNCENREKAVGLHLPGNLVSAYRCVSVSLVFARDVCIFKLFYIGVSFSDFGRSWMVGRDPTVPRVWAEAGSLGGLSGRFFMPTPSSLSLFSAAILRSYKPTNG